MMAFFGQRKETLQCAYNNRTEVICQKPQMVEVPEHKTRAKWQVAGHEKGSVAMSEKLELLLNVALEATPQEREKSETLQVGFDPQDRTWEVIVKYHGDLFFLEELSIGVEQLLAGYAILHVPESRMPLLSETEQIEYVEKPTRLYFQTFAGKQASCVLPVTIRPPYLSGKGVLIGIADSGIDFRHADFRNADGTTKIVALWDQSLPPDEERGRKPPDGFRMGTEFTTAQINAALSAEGTAATDEIRDVRDTSGHGTAVAGIAGGNGGVAPESGLLIVKLGIPQEDSFPRTTELMRALTYLVKKAVEIGAPIAVNISFGNTYGPHDSGSLLERFLDNVSEVGRCVICVGSGNEGAGMGHASGNLTQARREELSVGMYQGAFSLQLWKNYADTFRITLTSPTGSTAVFSTDEQEAERIRRMTLGGTQVLLYIGEPTPYSAQQEVYLDFLPRERFVDSGVWALTLEAVKIVTGNYSLYLPSQTALGADTRFFRPTPETTLTIPSTASRAITVGAYQTTNDAYVDFSGRGYLFATDAQERLGIIQSKPDLVAPGVGIRTAASGGGYGSVTGTSFATPFVTGAAALLMEWGIVMGNDRYLYGQKVKAYLQRGARQLPGFEAFPNEMVGYGALCVEDSLPG